MDCENNNSSFLDVVFQQIIPDNAKRIVDDSSEHLNAIDMHMSNSNTKANNVLYCYDEAINFKPQQKSNNDNVVSLNVIVQKTYLDSIQNFMLHWMKCENKNFRIVFIQNENTSKEERHAISYAIDFATILGHHECIYVATSECEVPKAEQTIVLKDTSILPVDKMEVLRMRTEASKQKIEDQKIEKLEEKVEQNIETKTAIENKQKLVEKDDATKMMLQQKPMNDEVGQKKEVEKNKIIVKDKCKPRIVCYTCITGGYDQILEPLVSSPNIDFICFSDKQIQSKTWKWRQIPDDLKDLDKIRQQRSIKICPHRYLKEYDISIWVDGNIQIKDDLNKFIKQYNLEVCPLWIRKHPKRDCIYAEAKECIAQRKAPKEIIEKQIAKYRAVKYPEHNKLVESGIILRKHVAVECQQICNIWLTEVLTESYRDQLSFNYACWAAKFRYGTLIYEPEIIDNKNKYFNWNRFHASQTVSSQNKCQSKYDTSYVTVTICNFNTTEMTTDCILSIRKNSGLKKTKFVVLDNSYPNKKFQMSNKLNGIDIQLIDNSNGKIIDFNAALKKFSKIPIKANNNGSLKHCLSIQFLLNACRSRDMLLFDSDTILLKQIDFINPAYVTIADLEKKGDPCSRAPCGKYLSETRFLPFIQYFNCDLIKRKALKYFYPNRIHGGLTFSGNYYDTGASFYEDVINANLPFKRIQYKEYINHLDHGSWRKH